MYTYQEKSEELLNPVVHQQPYSAHQLPFSPPQQQFYAFSRPSPCTGSTSALWQPPPPQWPTTVQRNMSVWGSQSPAWVQTQMTELQPTTVVTQGLSNIATTSTPIQSGEQSVNLTSLVNSSLEMCNSPLNRVSGPYGECRDGEGQ
ncbi:uncharacterized protein LOC134250156 [Saccostrea cucullata]|uniref:uncharacterized protein LOC134250156 n=1 Tax=Saccostrea cuccullata TaxID=36930 RepID=UPI002ED5F5BB